MKKGLKILLLFIMMIVMMQFCNNVEAAVPNYTYSGTSSTKENTNYWYIYLKSDGTFTLSTTQYVDIFLAGGGGGGGTDNGGGGGGGYTQTRTGQPIEPGEHEITIGAGGVRAADQLTVGGTGGQTIAFGLTANGGTGGNSWGTVSHGGDYTEPIPGGTGTGSGGQGTWVEGNNTAGGTGIRPFGDTTIGYLCGGGGGGGTTATSGGSGGGGAGGAKDYNGTQGTANTGGGGGGAGATGQEDVFYYGGAGGSGVVIIRGIKCTNHTGGTHDNEGRCTTCGEIYQTHGQSAAVANYTLTTTQHTPNYSCIYSGCSATYVGVAEDHGGSGTCIVCGAEYQSQTHTQSSTVAMYKQTATQHTPVYGCNEDDCTHLYLGTAENHTGATSGNGGKCTVCGYKYQTVTGVPEYTYSGTSTTKESEDYWYIYLTSDGTFTLNSTQTVDIFIAGGGGGGGCDNGGGGGSGYNNSVTQKKLSSGEYDITIGSGGSGSTNNSSTAGSGGQTIAFGLIANGGNGGDSWGQGVAGGTGGANGGDGYTAGGTGIIPFDDLTIGYLCGGGGGGGGDTSYGEGGAGGGGNGGKSRLAGDPGTANTGGGGGGGGGYQAAGGAGGSGVVIIRGRLCTEHTGGTAENGWTCTVCGVEYQSQTHTQSATLAMYKQTETQHIPVYGCNESDCNHLYLGAAVSHSGATHANGGKCTVCGYQYEIHSKSENIVSYTQQAEYHIPVYSCTKSGCGTTYTGEVELHNGVIELHVASSSCVACGYVGEEESDGNTYVLKINYAGNEITRNVKSGDLVTIRLGNQENRTYTANVVLRAFENYRQFVMPNDNVEITIEDMN